MVDYSRLHAETERRLDSVLAELHDTLTESEREEVLDFLRVGEYGLALDVLSHILVEENKAFGNGVLRQIDDLAAAMDMRDEPILTDLHHSYERHQRSNTTG